MAVRAGHATRSRRGAGFVLAAAAIGLVVIAVIGWAGLPSDGPAVTWAGNTHDSLFVRAGSSASATLRTAASGLASPLGLTLGLGVVPGAICVAGEQACPAGTDTARVTLSANAQGASSASWPAVQVAFVLETTPYDGVYDPINGGEPGADPCALAGSHVDRPCEESNGVPFFATHAQAIATAIAAANPRTQVSFALVDYFATIDDWDDGDGVEYHVDVPSFLPANTFGAAVQNTFVSGVLTYDLQYEDSDLADNFLHSSSITALYGTLEGSGIGWSANTHHVIVWMGSTAPRDPNYRENYCVSPHIYAPDPSGPCDGSTCEPAYSFTDGSSQQCVGWVRSVDGVPADSIAGLAQSASECTASVGGVCTIDAIDYWDTPTDPYSAGWPDGLAWTSIGGGPGGPVVLEDSANILAAGCAIAAATGGTWDGPAYWTCPDGSSGNLQFAGPGPSGPPNTANPTLFQALTHIGFGPVVERAVAAGTDVPLFTFVPFGNIALSTTLGATAACERGGSPFDFCQATPSVLHSGGITYLGWNWSSAPSANAMYGGDEWSASFDVVATGPPYQIVPVDACESADCQASGSNAVGSLYSRVSYTAGTGGPAVVASFPLGTVRVEASPTPTLGVPPAPPASSGAIPPTGTPTAVPGPLPVVLQFGATPAFGFGQVTFQVIAAGFLAAGFVRVTLRHKAIEIRVTASTARAAPKYGTESMRPRGRRSRFE